MAEPEHSAHLKNTDTAYITASDGGRFVGYTGDYVARLAREGKVAGRRIGHQWFVEKESLAVFAADAEKQKRLRGEAIREERKREQKASVETKAEKRILGVLGVSETLPENIPAVAQRLAVKAYEFHANNSLTSRVRSLSVALGVVFTGAALGVLMSTHSIDLPPPPN